MGPALKGPCGSAVVITMKKPDMQCWAVTSPPVGCLVYPHNVVSIVLSLYTMFLLLTVAKAMILRCARVFLPWGQTQMPLIIRDDLDDDNEEIEDVFFKVLKLTHDYSMTMCDHMMCFYVLYLIFSLIPLMIDYLQVIDVERC